MPSNTNATKNLLKEKGLKVTAIPESRNESVAPTISVAKDIFQEWFWVNQKTKDSEVSF